MINNQGFNVNHIAMFIPALSGGGAERVFLNLAHSFIKKGLKVDLILCEVKGPYLKDVAYGVNIVDLMSNNPIKQTANLVRYLKREKPDAIISALNLSNIVSSVAHFIANIDTKLIITQHNIIGHTTVRNSSFITKIKREFIIPTLFKKLFPRADLVVSVSKGVANNLAEKLDLDKKNIKVIYNPVVSDELLKMGEEDLKHPWFQKDVQPVILGVGSLTVQKDFQNLIQAFIKIREKKPAKLLILGEGSERNNLEKLIQQYDLQSDVQLLGFVNNPFKYMKNSSVFVLSSRWEGFGLVLVEAMVFGTPIVSTDCPSGPAEILENGRWGKLVPIGDSETLAKEILDTLNGNYKNPEKRAMEFTIDNAAREYLEALSML